MTMTTLVYQSDPTKHHIGRRSHKAVSVWTYLDFCLVGSMFISYDSIWQHKLDIVYGFVWSIVVSCPHIGLVSWHLPTTTVPIECIPAYLDRLVYCLPVKSPIFHNTQLTLAHHLPLHNKQLTHPLYPYSCYSNAGLWRVNIDGVGC